MPVILRLIRGGACRLFEAVSAEDGGGIALKAARALLFPLTYVYLAATLLKRKLSGKRRLPCPVISVGNIVCGGSGKTPAVRYLAEMLVGNGQRPAILSRGYMGRAGSGGIVVCDGEKTLSGPVEAGDEPFMLAECLKGAPVLAGKDRFRTGQAAVERFGASCVILDDGFQHYALERDMDIIVIDSTSPFGNGHLLPRGTLREKPESLKRADFIILTHVDFCGDISAVRTLIRRAAGNKPVLETVHAPCGFIDLGTGGVSSPRALSGRKAVVFSGVGRPLFFERAVASRGLSPLKSFRFPDHHDYTPGDMEFLSEQARGAGADCMITTLKDAGRVKAAGLPEGVRIFAMDVRLRPVNGSAELQRALGALLSEGAAS